MSDNSMDLDSGEGPSTRPTVPPPNQPAEGETVKLVKLYVKQCKGDPVAVSPYSNQEVSNLKDLAMSALGISGSPGNVKLYIDENSENSLEVDDTIMDVVKAIFDKHKLNSWADYKARHALIVKTIAAVAPVVQGIVLPTAHYLALCNVGFYSNFISAKFENNYLTFCDEIPSTANLKKLFVRSSYKTIAEKIMDRGQGAQRHAIIIGTPGIGKSLFLFYLLWKLLQNKGERVLFVYGDDKIYYDGQGGVFEIDQLPPVLNHDFWTKDLWCLFDAKKKNTINWLPFTKCSFILSTSPRKDLYNDFKKEEPEPLWNYMPIWTEEEMQNLATNCFPGRNDTWRQRFEILGGVPRFVFEKIRTDATELVLIACTQCDLNDVIRIIGPHSTISDKTKVVHTLIHMDSVAPFDECSVQYASQTVLEIIVRKKGDEARREMQSLLASCNGNPLASALCGYIFEPYAIDLLEKGGTFTCRQLVHGNTRDITANFELEIPPSINVRQTADNVETGQSPNQLYVPKTKNYTALDAWMPGIGGFQMTVGKSHDLKAECEQDLAKLGDGAKKLYWLLPPLYYRSFTKKTPQTIDQYALLIPYPQL